MAEVCGLWQTFPKTSSELVGIMPRVDGKDPEVLPEDLVMDLAEFVTYVGVEDDQDVAEVIERYVDAGYLKPCGTASEVERFVGGRFMLGFKRQGSTNMARLS